MAGVIAFEGSLSRWIRVSAISGKVRKGGLTRLLVSRFFWEDFALVGLSFLGFVHHYANDTASINEPTRGFEFVSTSRPPQTLIAELPILVDSKVRSSRFKR
jgi:hypothetical protein